MSRGNIDGIILAGGLGTRLKEVVQDLPKPLAPVGGRPFLDLVLASLASCQRLGKVIMATGYLSGKVVETYSGRSDFPFEIGFSVEETPLGTGGAIRKALDQVETDEVIALNGDSIAEVSWEELFRFHARSNGVMTIVLRTVDNPGRFGTVILGGNGRVIRFEEKRPGSQPGPINAGIYLFRRSLFYGVPSGETLSLERDLIPQFLEKGVYGFVTQGKFIDIGVPEDYRIAGEYLEGN
jgi:D-glycero-alpha-D-manno-heptose 1-phosphate guanylyltransferase